MSDFNEPVDEIHAMSIEEVAGIRADLQRARIRLGLAEPGEDWYEWIQAHYEERARYRRAMGP